MFNPFSGLALASELRIRPCYQFTLALQLCSFSCAKVKAVEIAWTKRPGSATRQILQLSHGSSYAPSRQRCLEELVGGGSPTLPDGSAWWRVGSRGLGDEDRDSL